MPFSLIPFLLLVIPMAEIAMFILVGSQIGVLPTLGLIVLTAIIGSILLRVQGLGILQRIAAETRVGRVPGRELIHGAMILVAGVLLLTPGFVTDTLGLLLFIPKLREAGWRLLRNRITIIATNQAAGFRAGSGSPFGASSQRWNERGADAGRKPVIELDDEDYRRDPSPDTPWRQRPDEPTRH
jgi:UPF0716 protein FxsA